MSLEEGAGGSQAAGVLSLCCHLLLRNTNTQSDGGSQVITIPRNNKKVTYNARSQYLTECVCLILVKLSNYTQH